MPMLSFDTSPSPYAGVTAMVLGATGFIGRWVARALSVCGARVVVVARDRRAAERVCATYGIDASIVVHDLGAGAGLSRLLGEVSPSIVFNLAGYGVQRNQRDAQQAQQLNALLVRALCEAVSQRRDPQWPGQDIVHAGSVLEYGPIGGDLAEEAEARPTTLYGRSKLEGTRALQDCCRLHQIRAVVARLFTVYGPGEPPGRLLPSLLDAASSRRPLDLTAGNQERDFTYVEDVAEGLLRLGLAATGFGEVINLATGRLTPVRQFVETAARILNISEAHLRFGAVPVTTDELQHRPVTLVRLRLRTGWRPPTEIAAGVRKTLDFALAPGNHIQ